MPFVVKPSQNNLLLSHGAMIGLLGYYYLDQMFVYINLFHCTFTKLSGRPVNTSCKDVKGVFISKENILFVSVNGIQYLRLLFNHFAKVLLEER